VETLALHFGIVLSAKDTFNLNFELEIWPNCGYKSTSFTA